MVLPKMRTEPVMSRMSLNTPASVRTRPLPAPTRNTAATLRRKATAALLRRMSGLCGVHKYTLAAVRTFDIYDTGRKGEGTERDRTETHPTRIIS